MTKEELIRMANQAFDESSFTDSEALRFAALVAAAERERAIAIANDMKEKLQAKFEQTYMEGVIAGAAAEREACAKVCEERSKGWDNPRPARDEAEAMMRYAAKHEARALGEAIRARSES
jgi:hypothetical protein